MLESLVALGVFSLIASTFLVAIQQGHREVLQAKQEQEVLQVAKMAIQTNQDHLTINGVSVTVEKTQKTLAVRHEGKQIIYVEKK